MGAFDSRTLTDISRYSNQNRLLGLVIQPKSSLEHINIVVDRFEGYEALSEEYEYKIDLLSDNAYWKLNDVVGLSVGLTILQADGDKRVVCGFVQTCESLGADGGFSKYRITVVPFPAFLAETLKTRDFADKTSIKTALAVLSRHTQSNSQAQKFFRVVDNTTKKYPARSLCRQFWESDLFFFRRITREDGISYRYTHTIEDKMPVHTLEFFDQGLNLPKCTQENIKFHRDDGTEEAGTATQFFAKRTIRASLHSMLTTEYKSATRPSAFQETKVDQGDYGKAIAATLEQYQPVGAYYASSEEELKEYARLRQQAHDLKSKCFTMTSTVSNLCSGVWFTLTGHPELDAAHYSEDRQFIVLEMRLKGRNNLGHLDVPGSTAHAAENKEPVYQNEAVVVRRYIPIVPEYTQEFAKPRARGPLTGRVVGPQGSVVHTDSMGRILVQLDCMRSADHPEGNANSDDKSSYWVRWVSRGAGHGFGEQNLPWVGQEVLIDFIDGDTDRMIATAVIHNGRQINTRFSDKGGLPTEKVLVGTKASSHDGNGYNQTVYDCTPNELSAQLFSSQAQSSLKLGFVGTPRESGKSTSRGDGFELYTEAAGSIRGAMSLLLTAEPLAHGVGNQLHREALLKTLDAALMLAEKAGEQAKNQQANLPETGKDNQLVKDDAATDKPARHGHQAHLTEALHNLERGTSTDPNGKSGKGDQAGQQSIVAISAPDGIAIATPQSTTLATGTNFDQVAMRDTTQTTGRRWIHNVTESISLFVNGAAAKIADTFKLIAAKGNINMQAQSGQILATALKDFTLTSVEGKLILQAPKEVYITAGGGYIRVGENIEIHNPGTQSQKAGKFSLSSPASAEAALPSWKQPKLCDFKMSGAAASGAATVPVA